jgi:hypothetical protein
MAPLRLSNEPEYEVITGGTGKPESRGMRTLHVVGSAAKKSLTLFNPKQIYREAKEDIRIFREAKSITDSEIVGKHEVIAAKIHGKLTAGIAISEFVGTYIGAWSVGVALQELTKNAYWGVAGTIIGDYLPAVVSFQAAWLALNVSYYKNSAKSFWGKVKHFYKDILPLHAAAVVAAVPAYIVGGAVSSGIIALVNNFFPHGAEKIHVMPLISETINFGVVEVIYLTLLASQAVNYAKSITNRYSAYLDRMFSKNDAAGGSLV